MADGIADARLGCPQVGGQKTIVNGSRNGPSMLLACDSIRIRSASPFPPFTPFPPVQSPSHPKGPFGTTSQTAQVGYAEAAQFYARAAEIYDAGKQPLDAAWMHVSRGDCHSKRREDSSAAECDSDGLRLFLSLEDASDYHLAEYYRDRTSQRQPELLSLVGGQLREFRSIEGRPGDGFRRHRIHQVTAHVVFGGGPADIGGLQLLGDKLGDGKINRQACRRTFQAENRGSTVHGVVPVLPTGIGKMYR